MSRQQQTCFHCGLPHSEGTKYAVVIHDQRQIMCCPGCEAVAQAIVDNGLADYYTFRTEPAAKGDELLDETMAKLAVYDNPAIQEEFVIESGQHRQIQLTVEGITCAACGWLIEKQMSKLAGIKQIAVNVSARRATLTWDPESIALSQVLHTFQKIGYRAAPFQQDQHEAIYHAEQKAYLKKVGLAGIMTMQVMMLMAGLYFDWFGNIEAETRHYLYLVSLVLTTPVVFFSGSVFYLSALKALAAKTINMDVPVTLAIWGTYLAGIKSIWLGSGDVYFESICMFVFFLLLSRFLEHRSRHKASLISANMLQYIPVTANLKQDNRYKCVLAKQLAVGQVVLVKPGETVPVDGIVVDGESQVDESMLNGEFEPARKFSGSTVYGGTVNQAGSIEVRVEQTLKYALVNQIVRLQEQAMATKPKIAMVADVLSRYFVVVVLAISALTFGFWHWRGEPDAFWIMISVLIATCPCALGLATPSALTCAMAKLNKQGVVLKRADALEQLTQINAVVLDKTGTLTHGKFAIEQQWYHQPQAKEQLFAIACALESRSEHPIAKAFIGDIPGAETSASSGIQPRVKDFSVTLGGGIAGEVNGTTYQMGSARFVDVKAHANWSSIEHEVEQANVLLSDGTHILAAFWLADQVKSDAKPLIEALPVSTITILSGDSHAAVRHIAQALGVNHFVAQQTPQDKLDYVQAQQKQGHKLLMLGDGINDAPVLAQADVSAAVGNATDLAKNAADVILLNEKISSLPQLFTMARRTKRKILQNMAWALGYNLLVLPFAVSGLLEPWMAAVGMSLSSLIVVTNSTRLLTDTQHSEVHQ
ncbi:heavy metal translocating P-type ATPase [Alteromonas oceanisediminis]|uniref:heavy metal translocating P-type ATPase n=1 Tax=Alteromonas oceanisediminis TaxID=2836180 RepID=UPI002023B0D4|nr:heavy metal translocating P-type ATPase [Alteromonas oceanisediminis]